MLGTRVDEACAVLDAAGRSLARQHRPGAARFSIACLDPDADAAARALFAALGDDAAWYDERSVDELLDETAGELTGAEATPHYLLVYAVDALRRLPDGEAGPAAAAPDPARRARAAHPSARLVARVWRGCAPTWAARRRAPTRSAPGWRWTCRAPNSRRCIPAREVHTGIPRPWRALFFDRAVHRTGQVIIPYGPQS